MPEERAGIIGCGGMGKAHARGYREAGCEIVAIAEQDETRRKEFADEFGVENTYASHEELLASDLDLISICTWPTTHCDITLAAASSGVRGILCEKPLAITLDEADRMLEACRQNDVTLASGHQHRYSPQSVQAREWIDAGRIGEPVYFWGHCNLDLMNNGTHVVDLLHFFNSDSPAEWVMGQTDCRSKARGRANHPDMPAEDASIGEIRYANGLRACVEMGEFAPPAYQFHLYGTEGQIDVNPPGGPSVRLLSSSGSGWEIPELDTGVNPTLKKVVEFVNAVRDGREPACSGAIARQILEVLIGVFESSRRRALIEMPVEARDFPLEELFSGT
jgi:UDP-N-acetylglucosamine 3-dehydrogenase